MTIEDQQDQTIEDFIDVLSSMISSFHKTFGILDAKPVDEYSTDSKESFVKEATEDLMSRWSEKKEMFSKSCIDERIGRHFRIPVIHLPGLIRIRSKWKEDFAHHLHRKLNSKEADRLFHELQDESYINSPQCGGMDPMMLLLKATTIRNIIEKRMLKFSNVDQRRHYLRVYVPLPRNAPVRPKLRNRMLQTV